MSLKYFYGEIAVKDISFSLNDGEKIALLSGAEGGKTTVLKAIAGFYPATSGSIFINGKDETASEPKKPDVMFIHQDGGIIKLRTVRFNLSYPLRLRKVAKEVRKKTVEKVAKQIGISPILNDFGYLLQPEYIVKTAYARTLMREASLYLIDDVLSLLPYGTRSDLFYSEILPIIKSLKGAIVFATTSIEEAFSVAEKVLVLNYGIVEQIGTYSELSEAPASLFVEKLVNDTANISEADGELNGQGIFYNIHGYKVSSPFGEEYANKRVFLSYYLKKDDGGILLPPKTTYFKNGKFITAFENNEVIEGVYSIGDGARFKPDLNKGVKVFDYSTEKLLTIIK